LRINGSRWRRRHGRIRSPDARQRNCAAEQRESPETDCAQMNLNTPSARMGTGSETASQRFGGRQEILANA
jgi:hypothetical protein